MFRQFERKPLNAVSNPYRYSTNIFLTSNENREFSVSNPYRYSTNVFVLRRDARTKFQTLIGILQTALFLALFKLLSSF